LKVIRDSSFIENHRYNVCTVGYFDGIHLGHKKIIERLVSDAKKNNGKSILVSFWPHPRKVLYPNDHFDFIQSSDDKFKSLQKFGIDILYLIEFTEEFSKVTADDFIDQILEKQLKINKLIIGYNHHFGFRREGNFKYLASKKDELSFKIEEVKKKEISENLKISSSEIRNKIKEGDISNANQMLGYKYNISGKVVKGDGIGKKLEFPTANIEIKDDGKLLPSDGVYAGFTYVSDKKYYGMINIGFRPTLNGSERRLEMNLFDYGSEIYGESMEISFIKRIRDEKRFRNLKELSKQLRVDKIETLKIIENEEVRN
jgi:riboflavin kinase/FMN adenylyltransferase